MSVGAQAEMQRRVHVWCSPKRLEVVNIWVAAKAPGTDEFFQEQHQWAEDRARGNRNTEKVDRRRRAPEEIVYK